MQQPFHAIGHGAGSRMTPERAVGIGFVALLHVIAIWALVSGLAMKMVRQAIQPPIVITLDHEKAPPMPPPPKPTIPTVPTAVDMPMPTFEIARDTQTTAPPATHQQQQTLAQVAPDTVAAGVVSTHTTPPYPALARRLGEQGSVRLRLAISAQGVVTAAQVEKSSGFADLDQAAVIWVQEHWKYKPATQAGVAVASTTEAVVVFNLKNAG